MNLGIPEAARLLAISENTLYSWIRDRKFPAHRERHQYYVNRVELLEWADANHHRVLPEILASPEEQASSDLMAAMERGGVHRDVPGKGREEVLEAIARLPGIPDIVDRGLLVQLLLAREKLSTTGLGRGIAFPHPRAPIILRRDEPRVLICFPEMPVDIGAVDGQPVHTLFLLLAPTVRLHLHLLAHLSFALHDERLRDMLKARAQSDAIFERFRALEKEHV